MSGHPWRNAAIALLLGAILLLGFRSTHAQTAATDSQQSAPILLSGVKEPEEMRVEPVPLIVPTASEKMLAAETKNLRDLTIPALDAVLAKFPDYSDGYAMRAGLFCQHGRDPSPILSDVNNALKYESNSGVKGSMAGLLSMRAKLEYASGDKAVAFADLWRAINSNLTDADKFANSGAVKPEKTASICTWTEPDMDALVKQFPADYRPYLLRGLYFSFFTTFSSDQSMLNQAVENFHKAADVNPHAALPHYYLAEVLLRWSFFKKFSMSSEQHVAFNRTILDELNKAIALDAKLGPALLDRANFYLDHKQTPQAISDYDSFLKLQLHNADALDGLGHAEIDIGNPYEAISDFGKAIDALKGSNDIANEYATRADAYMKTDQWDLAIKDLTSAISLQIGKQIILMNIGQFRALYPQYNAASNEAIAHKLNRTFFPNMKYDDFAKLFLQTNHGWTPDTTYYLERSRAYLRAGEWDSAVDDFRRAKTGADFAMDDDRWGEITSSQNMQWYIDMRTLDNPRSGSAKVWVKEVQGSGDDAGAYSLQQYELNCGARQIRATSVADYDASGKLTGSHQGERWASVVPETLGETLYNGVCRSHL